MGTKLATITALVLTAVSVVLFVGLIRRERAGLVDAKQNAAVMVGELLAASLGAPLDFGDVAAVEAELGHLKRNAAVIAVAVWSEGSDDEVSRWLRDPKSSLELKPARTETERVLANRIEVYRDVQTEGGKRVGHAALAFSLAPENLEFERRRSTFLILSLILAAVVAGVLIAITRFLIVSRVTTLARSARDLQDAGVLRPVAVTSDDELGQLAAAFNRMGQAVVDRARRMQEELEVAARIQTSILPRRLDVPGLEIAARMHPASEAGGDYYEVLPTEDGCWLGIGDVSGHGLNAGLGMMMIQSMIAALVRQNPNESPKKLITIANRALVDNVRTRLESSDYASLALLRYHADGRVVYAGEHEALLLYRANKREIEVIPLKGAWVGVLQDVEDLTQDESFRLEDGDVVLLYTDGAPEARSVAGEFFMMDRFKDEFLKVIDRPAEEITNHLVNAVLSFRAEPEDDVTVLVARYRRVPEVSKSSASSEGRNK